MQLNLLWTSTEPFPRSAALRSLCGRPALFPSSSPCRPCDRSSNKWPAPVRLSLPQVDVGGGELLALLALRAAAAPVGSNSRFSDTPCRRGHLALLAAGTIDRWTLDGGLGQWRAE